jgi:hypothetical protein
MTNCELTEATGTNPSDVAPVLLLLIQSAYTAVTLKGALVANPVTVLSCAQHDTAFVEIMAATVEHPVASH